MLPPPSEIVLKIYALVSCSVTFQQVLLAAGSARIRCTVHGHADKSHLSSTFPRVVHSMCYEVHKAVVVGSHSRSFDNTCYTRVRAYLSRS